MFDIIDDHSESSHLIRRYSVDGVNWSPPEMLCDPFTFPNHAHNVGVSGDQNGYLLAEGVLIGYGAPHTDDVDRIFSIQDMSCGALGSLRPFPRRFVCGARRLLCEFERDLVLRWAELRGLHIRRPFPNASTWESGPIPR